MTARPTYHYQLTVKSGWPITPKDDERGRKSALVAKESSKKSPVATVSIQSSCGNNRMSNKFARKMLGPLGFELARSSKAAGFIGQVGTILSCPAEPKLWTAYFILVDIVDFDMIMTCPSWPPQQHLAPSPRPELLIDLPLPRKKGTEKGTMEAHDRSKGQIVVLESKHHAKFVGTRHEKTPSPRITRHGHARSWAISPYSKPLSFAASTVPPSDSSVDSRSELTKSRSPSLASSVSSVAESDVNDDCLDHIILAEGLHGSGRAPCRKWLDKSEIHDVKCPELVEDENWVWDVKRQRAHMRDRSEDDPGYWYPEEFA